MAALYEAGWSRYGWPLEVGGFGGTIAHRAVMWEALARHGVASMALFEHLEILAPTLVAHGPTAFVAHALPSFLSGSELWAQGFSEPDAGSDLASLRTRATPDGDGFLITGRKIWTSWARYARWCLVLARTGPTESRHRGLTAFIVDLRAPGVEVSAIEQANGTDELAEVAFDGVYVGADRIVGELDGGWAIAMHILSHERGTFAWFRHCFLYQHLRACAEHASDRDERGLGEALLDLAAVTATAHAGVAAHSTGVTLGPKAAYTKLLLCVSEQAVNDCVLESEPELAVGAQTAEVALQRQDYLFSRIVTVYGGSQQMQLNTIAKQILQRPLKYDHDGSDDEFLTAACRVIQASAGSAALDALDWWQLLPHLGDADARAAVFATFRAQGRELGSSPALGGLLAQPYRRSHRDLGGIGRGRGTPSIQAKGHRVGHPRRHRGADVAVRRAWRGRLPDRGRRSRAAPRRRPWPGGHPRDLPGSLPPPALADRRPRAAGPGTEHLPRASRGGLRDPRHDRTGGRPRRRACGQPRAVRAADRRLPGGAPSARLGQDRLPRPRQRHPRGDPPARQPADALRRGRQGIRGSQRTTRVRTIPPGPRRHRFHGRALPSPSPQSRPAARRACWAPQPS